jgi:small conductance mechanosensitive channel
MFGCGLAVWLMQRLVRRRDQQLAEKAQVDDGAAPPTGPMPSLGAQRLIFLGSLKDQFTLQRRRGLLAIAQWVLVWLQVLILLVGASMLFSTFPWTRDLSWQVLRVPLSLLIVWFVAGLINRVGDVAIARLARTWEELDIFALQAGQRRSLRVATTVSAFGGVKTFTVYSLALAFALGNLGVPIGSVLALGGLVAFAITFGLQNLLKDLVNGVLILWEDQYAIGDVIVIGDAMGVVENLNLRITQIRNAEGRLITIPNSTVTRAENLTRGWSRVDLMVDIAYESDLTRALTVMHQVAADFYADPKWGARLPEPPQVLGVENIAHTGLQLRTWIKTNPGAQWEVGREFRLRVRLAFEAASIAIGRPQQTVQFRSEGRAEPLSLPKE